MDLDDVSERPKGQRDDLVLVSPLRTLHEMEKLQPAVPQ